MTMRNERTKAQLYFGSYHPNGRKRYKRIDERIVGSFHAVRMKDKMISYKERIEP